MHKFILISLLFSQPILAWNFVEKSLEVGLAYEHNYGDSVTVKEPHIIAGGLAIGDVNGDGWDDIFAVTGEILDINSMNSNPNKLFIAQQDGTYIEQSSDFGLSPSDSRNAGPLIADLNGDGLRDLIFGSIDQEFDPELKLYFNSNNTSFISVNHSLYASETYSISAADTDKDGDLDLLLSHWLNDTEHNYWLNDGNGTFTDVTTTHLNISPIENSFTTIFADINNDNYDDLLLTNDFGTSLYFKNNQDGSMSYENTDVINDENGMGAAVGDYDNDGDLDWFASSIYDSDGISEGNWGVSGNRLYQNNGDGSFNEISETAQVREGYWGWGSCFADFNNDMYLDIFHVNGFPTASIGEQEFESDASRLFINNQDGTFIEMSENLGLIDSGMGRAIICFDNDRDGDIDILINNNQGFSKFYENQLDNNSHFLSVKLIQQGSNIDAIGAKISITANGVTQLRQVFSGGSFASSNPTTQHFGLAENSLIDLLEITWPDGQFERYENIQTDRLLTITRGQTANSDPFNVPISIYSMLILIALILFAFFIRRTDLIQ